MGFLHAFVIPKDVPFALHTANKLFRRDVPVDFIAVGNKQADDICRVSLILGAGGRII